MSATRVEEVYKIIVHKCYDDYVGLWVIVSHLKTRGVKDEDAIRSETMKVVVRLMSSMGIVAGLPHADGSFERWPITRGEVMTRINREWDVLGRQPNIGDIVWFTHVSEKADG